MKLYDKFKIEMPSNGQLCEDAARDYLRDHDSGYIRNNFSNLIDELNREVYKKYLEAQSKSGQQIVEARITEGLNNLYEEFDSFFMSVFQSRKSRAGGAFEFIIKELFIRLGYPFATQVNIEGATPDFVLPSEKHFREDPLGSIIFTAKRTLRERWRQVVTEANKGYGFFLATIDNKVTASQIKQMEKHKVHMIVPESLHNDIDHYKEANNVITFENFFKHYLDPAMDRWGLKVSEPQPPEYNTGQKDLF
jgi:restriction endonuclease EcoRII-like protein